jgi:hypothetical protein
MRGDLVDDERLIELDAADGRALRAEPARLGDGLVIKRRDRCGDLGARRSGDLRSPN